MKSLSIAILTIGVIAAILFKPDLWLLIILVGLAGAVAIDEVE